MTKLLEPYKYETFFWNFWTKLRLEGADTHGLAGPPAAAAFIIKDA